MEGQEGGGLLETLWAAGSENISCIVRIGSALLRGFILRLLEQEGGLPRQVPPEELGGEVGEETAVASLRAAVFRVWDRLSQDPEMDRLVGSLAGCSPLPALADVSEQLFQDGINWGRVVVFFYFTYRVVRQAVWGALPLRTIFDWAISFLQQRLSAWIQQQGGWVSILSYSPPQLSQDPRAVGSPENWGAGGGADAWVPGGRGVRQGGPQCWGRQRGEDTSPAAWVPFPRPPLAGYKPPAVLCAGRAAFSLQQCLNGTGPLPPRHPSVSPSICPSIPSLHPAASAHHGLPDPPELPPRLRGRRQPHGQHGAPRLLRLPLHGILLRAGRRGAAPLGTLLLGAVARGARTRRGAAALPDTPWRPRAAAGRQEAGA